MKFKKIFLISPVRTLSESQKEILDLYIKDLEDKGYIVHFPYRDTDQTKKETEIIKQNFKAIAEAEEVHIAWDPMSLGSHFDLGVAYALNKVIVLVPGFQIFKTKSKSFDNFLLDLDKMYNEEVLYEG